MKFTGQVLDAVWIKSKKKFLETFEGGDLEAFSPTMLEVQTSPPAPLARSIAWSVSAALFLFALWSLWADFDITVSSVGNAIPSAKTKVVQALEVGRVTVIHVKDGDEVQQGQLLIELDATMAAADREKSGQDTQDAQLDVLRLGAQLRGSSQLPTPPRNAHPITVERQKHLLLSRVGEQEQKMAVLEQEIARKSADLAATYANMQKTEQTLPMLQQRLAMRDKLWKEGFMAEISVIESRLEVSSQINELAVFKERLKESKSALKAADLARSQAQAEYVSRVSAEMTDAQRRMQTGHQEFVKASYREARQMLTAPISGTVQQLAVNTVGGVVNATQGLMTVVPKEGGIEVEAKVLNKDIGFLRIGMPVAVKLDAFEFTKYGSLDGVVQWVGADAIKDEQLGQIFLVRIVLKKTHLPVAVQGGHPEIRIGMSVTADVAIGKRKAYEYFLGPLLKYKNESLRER
ncbi:HlyD family type I secretion periplasmic adaptor subunit [Limnohabitans sp. Rim8]|uniref:HlyD family type I secretion periplasmic adaptor subunit n=1 Tax=Limnohabitans sp. Rim8 TaxID=1100718 RepID=UPI003305E82F